jgi:hypothetical protein
MSHSTRGRRLSASLVTAALTAGLVGSASAEAAPRVRQAAGVDAASITAARDAFRVDLGGGTTAGAGGSFGGLRREINWDGVPATTSDPNRFPSNGFLARGAFFTTPGTGFLVSSDTVLEFSGLNGDYLTAFAAFSPQKLFTPVDSRVTDVHFTLPATETPATTSGFGVVLSDVDAAGPTTLQLFDAGGTSLGTFTAPASGGDGGFSFLGVSFDAGERVGRARITTGDTALTSTASPADGPADIVVMDDFLYGEPQPVVAQPPPPSPPAADTTAPRVNLTGVPRKVDVKSLKRGLRVGIRPNEASRLEVALLGSARRATIARSFNLTLASRKLGLSSARRTVRLRPSKRLIGDAQRFRVQLRVVATDAAGNRRTVTRKIAVRP